MAGHRSVADLVADPIGGRAELVQQIALHGRLQVGVAVEPELAGETDDRRRSGAGGRARGRRPCRSPPPGAGRESPRRPVVRRSSARCRPPGCAPRPPSGRDGSAMPIDTAGACVRPILVPWTLPPAPRCSFASDNFAGAHPRVVDAVAAANTGHVMAYGDDVHTAECEARFRDLFGPTDADVPRVHGHRSQRARAGDDVEAGAGDRVHQLVAHRGRRDRRPRADPRRQADRSAERRRQAPPGAARRARAT